MDYTICVPIYKELPHIEANLESIDDWSHLLIVDNSVDGWCEKFEDRGAKIIREGENLGVARSWNLGIKEEKEYTFFVSSSVAFHEPFQAIAERVKLMIEAKTPGIEYGIFTQLGWHLNAITQKTVLKVGYFDENFYPAYEEDVDYCHRLYLAGLHPNQKGETRGSTIPSTMVYAKPVKIAATIKDAGLEVNFNALRNYYIKKWGGDHGQETFETPFNTGYLQYFPEKTIEELRKEYGLADEPCGFC